MNERRARRTSVQDTLISIATSLLLFAWRHVAYPPRSMPALDMFAFGVAVPALFFVGARAVRRHLAIVDNSGAPVVIRYSGLLWAFSVAIVVTGATTRESLEPGARLQEFAWRFVIGAVATVALFLWLGLAWTSIVRRSVGTDRESAD